jgi:nicotinamide-nucleotide amidase
VAYSNDVKKNILGVSQDSLDQYGAVSKAVALEMAKGVAKKLGADIGVSTTGIAGPGGGTEEKPVGLVWMGFWLNGEHFALRSVFTNDRLINKERTVMVVLESVRRHLLDIESMPYELKPHLA